MSHVVSACLASPCQRCARIAVECHCILRPHRFNSQDTIPLTGAQWTEGLELVEGRWTPDGMGIVLGCVRTRMRMSQAYEYYPIWPANEHAVSATVIVGVPYVSISVCVCVCARAAGTQQDRCTSTEWARLRLSHSDGPMTSFGRVTTQH